jgi:hypothetical protein
MSGTEISRLTPRINWRLAALVSAVAAGGLSLIAIGAIEAGQQDLAALLALAALGALGERLDTDLFGDSRVSVGMAAVLAAAAVAGLWGIALVVPIVVVIAHLRTTSAWYKRLFNAGAYTLAAAPLVGLLAAFGMETPGKDWPLVLAPAVLASLIAFAINSGLVATAIALDRSESVTAVWREKHRWLFPHYLLMGFGAIALASAYDLLGVWGIAVFALPMLSLRLAFQQYTRLARESALTLRRARLKEAGYRAVRSALDRVAATFDTAGPQTEGHGSRVAQLCRLVSGRLAIEPESRAWVMLEHAALLHDLGLLLLPREPFAKRGPLSEEEWTQVRRHPELVHSLLAGDAALSQVAEIIRAHHEWFDGSGYPRGLAGQGIPLAARILAVAEALDAMLAGRPYRAPLPLEAALAELERCEGSQFDPEVVHAFCAALTPATSGGSRALLRAYPLAS